MHVDWMGSMMASNYLGPYMLTCQLLPLLYKNAPRARIVNVVSFTHRCGTYNVLAHIAGLVSALKNGSLCYELPKL